MDIKERSALCENKTAVTTLCNEMLNVANRRAETFFTKLMPLGYKNFDDAIGAYCEDCNTKED